MLENLKFNFSFIGLCETWATIMNQDVLNIPNYNHEQCVRTKKRKDEDKPLYTLYYTVQKERRLITNKKCKQFSSLFNLENTGPKLWVCEILCSYI